MSNANKPYGTWYGTDGGRTTTHMTAEELAEREAFNLAHPLLPRSEAERAEREAIRLVESTAVEMANDPV